ncbi:MAG TPA: hypothetical protein VF487_20400 [Chitinophagaceae bacterium]
MRVLIACEYSGTVRDAFASLGHDAWSCDLLSSETPGNHFQCDVFEIINDGWDLMIAHPPCTYLSYAATKYWNQPGRARKRIKALEFFLNLWEAPINKICLENPIGVADAVITKHSQIIHPYYFGDSDMKRTCLWLKGLPKLEYVLQDDLFSMATATEKPEPIYVDKSGKKRYFTDTIGGYHGEGNSFKKRSKTFPGIANAMAMQWGGVFIIAIKKLAA